MAKIKVVTDSATGVPPELAQRLDIAVLLGTALRVKPLLQVVTGEVTAIATVRTREKALRRLTELVAAQDTFKELCVVHADAEEAAQEIVEGLSTVHPTDRLL